MSNKTSGWHRRFKEDFEMFDKLVVSEPEGADFKSRRRYFVTSSLVVGVLFLAAVVASIFAADFSLGSGSFELVQMLSPVDMAVVEPERPEPQQPRTQTQTQSQLPTRQSIMSRVDEPSVVPPTISTTQNTQLSRPIGDYRVAPFDSNPVGGTSSGREPSQDGGPSGQGGLAQSTPTNKTEETQLPPRGTNKPIVPRAPVSKGVLNGIAKSLPKPAYSAAARAVRAQGKVTVQVTIDERGSVVSANAVDGHHMLRADAERAARSAKFSPTYLSEMPVKVTGVITYNFIM